MASGEGQQLSHRCADDHPRRGHPVGTPSHGTPTDEDRHSGVEAASQLSKLAFELPQLLLDAHRQGDHPDVACGAERCQVLQGGAGPQHHRVPPGERDRVGDHHGANAMLVVRCTGNHGHRAGGRPTPQPGQHLLGQRGDQVLVGDRELVTFPAMADLFQGGLEQAVVDRQRSGSLHLGEDQIGQRLDVWAQGELKVGGYHGRR